MIIAIDGPAGSGKSTLAMLIAEKLKIHSFNTGMIFRAIAYFLNKKGMTIHDESKIATLLDNCDIKVCFENGQQKVYIDKEDVSEYVSLPSVAHIASEFSKLNVVREQVKQIQRKFAKTYDLVVEGRDIGTEIFPDADYKFFVIADLDTRAMRRYETLKKTIKGVDLNEIKEDLKKRDYEDSHREISPLRQADDAIVIDTTNDTVQQSLDKILCFIRR